MFWLVNRFTGWMPEHIWHFLLFIWFFSTISDHGDVVSSPPRWWFDIHILARLNACSPSRDRASRMLRQARARSAMDCHSSSVESVVSERTEGKDLRSVEPRRETRLNKNASGPGGHCDSTFQRRSHFEFKVFFGGGGPPGGAAVSVPTRFGWTARCFCRCFSAVSTECRAFLFFLHWCECKMKILIIK